MEREIIITTRDRLLRGWQNSMEMVRDFETYAKECKDDGNAANLFRQFAEDEGHHAAQFRTLLQQYQDS